MVEREDADGDRMDGVEISLPLGSADGAAAASLMGGNELNRTGGERSSVDLMRGNPGGVRFSACGDEGVGSSRSK